MYLFAGDTIFFIPVIIPFHFSCVAGPVSVVDRWF